MSKPRRKITIAASAAVSAVLGSIHSFSVVVPEWEAMLGADRGSVSLIYSLSLVSLTVAVLFGYHVYQRIPPFIVFAIVGVFAASGLLLSAGSSSLLVLPLDSVPIPVFVGLALVGYCYGAIIAVYPVAVADVFRALAAPRIYGQVFTAWGLAGLMAPLFSGWLFDQTGTYTYAFFMAMLLSELSIFAIRLCLPGSNAWGHR